MGVEARTETGRLRMSMKLGARRAAAAAAALAAVTSGFGAMAAERIVKVYNWSDYIDESILEDFTKETGIKVQYDVFDSNEILETKLLAGKTGYDVVVPSGNFLSRQIQAGVFQKLDKSKLSNLSNMWPVINERVAIYDPGNVYAIDYMWGTTGIGFNEAKIKERMPDAPVGSLDMLLKPEVVAKFKDCGIHVLDAPEEIIPIGMKYLGLDPNSNDPEDIKKSAAAWEAVRPNIQKFHSSEYINALANGDICLVLGWSGDILQARDRADEAKNGQVISYRIPKEGTQMWLDMMAIPKDAKNVAEAHEFLNYIMRPEVIAKASNFTNYANGNLASQQHLNKELFEDTTVYPDEATLQNLFVKKPYDSKTQRIVTRAWTKIVSGK